MKKREIKEISGRGSSEKHCKGEEIVSCFDGFQAMTDNPCGRGEFKRG
jgi:hypothetical protein